MERVILHSDFNNFYASVECLYNPSLRDKAVVVCGDVELRHGIVLAKNYVAKKLGIKTGDVIWQAQQKCTDLVVVPANFERYLRFSKLARKIYEDYTDKIESFGIDECWLDVTQSSKIFGGGELIANTLRERLKFELGITASIGVSWNKIYAKLGSDMQKPDATVVISKENYQSKIFHLPASDLLYVGRATFPKLKKFNINTIGEIANADVKFLKERLGKWGEYIWTFANGLDTTSVSSNLAESIIKSVGNSTTTVRDLKDETDVKMIVSVLSESVASRLREQGLKGQVISLYLQDKNLQSFGKQMKIKEPTFLSAEIIKQAMFIFKNFYDFTQPIRNVGVRVSDLSPANYPHQTSIFSSEKQRMKTEKMEKAVDELRRRFGHFIIRRGIEYFDKNLTMLNPKQEHIIHPLSYFK
ncbi:MAG: DNA polymerase IV [Clostridia bacterium]|nr:DNA polymerase IV [Clostridia bacterium]